jgi:hypothetical protein
MVVPEHFVIRIPPSADLAATVPLLCTGVTMFSPGVIAQGPIHQGSEPTGFGLPPAIHRACIPRHILR